MLDGEQDLPGLLRRQLDVVDERIRRALDLRSRIAELIESLNRKAGPSAGQLLQLIEESVLVGEPLTPQQLTELTAGRGRRMRELSDEEFAAMRQRRDQTWRALSRREQKRLMEQRRRMMPSAGT